MSGAGSYSGRQQFARGLAHWLSGFEPGFEFRVVELIDAGDRVLMHIAYHGRGRASGVELEQEWFNLWEIRDGKPFRCLNILDEGEALEAAGLPRL
jgi:ketosteroid isomerase-like protein